MFMKSTKSALETRLSADSEANSRKARWNARAPTPGKARSYMAERSVRKIWCSTWNNLLCPSPAEGQR